MFPGLPRLTLRRLVARLATRAAVTRRARGTRTRANVGRRGSAVATVRPPGVEPAAPVDGHHSRPLAEVTEGFTVAIGEHLAQSRRLGPALAFVHLFPVLEDLRRDLRLVKLKEAAVPAAQWIHNAGPFLLAGRKPPKSPWVLTRTRGRFVKTWDRERGFLLLFSLTSCWAVLFAPRENRRKSPITINRRAAFGR